MLAPQDGPRGRVTDIYIYIYTLAQIRPQHCTISSLALRRSAITQKFISHHSFCCFITPEVHYLTTLSVALSPQKFIISPLFLLLYHPRSSLSHQSFCCFITPEVHYLATLSVALSPRNSLSHHSFCCFITPEVHYLATLSVALSPQKFIISPLFLLLYHPEVHYLTTLSVA